MRTNLTSVTCLVITGLPGRLITFLGHLPFRVGVTASIEADQAGRVANLNTEVSKDQCGPRVTELATLSGSCAPCWVTR